MSNSKELEMLYEHKTTILQQKAREYLAAKEEQEAAKEAWIKSLKGE